MSSVHALLVGIDAYPAAPGLAPLRGCRNDVEAAAAYLRDDAGVPPGHIRVLTDAAATVTAVHDGFRRHLARAAAGDVALFWFSGHGSRAPVTQQCRALEPSGWTSSMVCVDSRVPGGEDLADKQVSALIKELARRRVRVVAVLDCCHSEGSTRGPAAARWAPPGSSPITVPDVPSLRDPASHAGARDASGPAVFPPHLLLAACGEREYAYETEVAGSPHGLFSATLLDALRRLGGTATGRQLLAAAGRDIRMVRNDQVPVLYPLVAAGPADRPLLASAEPTEPAPYLLRRTADGWEVDAGQCHGLRPDAAGLFQVAAGTDRGATATITRVSADRCRVQPVGWTPAPERQYPMTLVEVAVPPMPLTIGGTGDDDPGCIAALVEAVRRPPATAWLRIVERPVAGGLRVSAPTRGGRPQIRLSFSDGTPAIAPVAGHAAEDVQRATDRLVHLARWAGLRARRNPGSPLAGRVRIEVLPAYGDEPAAPPARAPLRPDAAGRIALAYTASAWGWTAPRVFIRLRNLSPHPLWCVLLDLTDRYASDPALFEGGWVGPGGCGDVNGGTAIEVALPDDRPAVPGAAVTDWLTVVYADAPLNTLPLQLPVPGEAPPHPTETRDLRVTRLPAHPVEWATAQLSVTTVVPFTVPGG